MNRSALVISILSFIGLAGCGSLVDQPPEKQVVADAVYQQIIEGMRRYKAESGVKVLAACVAWKDQETVSVSGLNWFYYPTRWTMRGRPVPELKQASLGECQSIVASEKLSGSVGCTCQIIDVNGRNAIVAPDEISSTSLRVEFPQPVASARTRPKASPPELVTSVEKLERKAGPTHARPNPSTTLQTLPQANPSTPPTAQEKLERKAGPGRTSEEERITKSY